jgi:hypothetical protein
MSKTSVIGIGDLHLQSSHPRNAARLQALDFIIDACTAADRLPTLGAWVLLGDLFHARSTAADRNALAARITRMGAHAPVVIIAGNHDLPGELDIFGRLDIHPIHKVHVVTTPQVLRVWPATGGLDLAIACLPYPHKGGLVASSPSGASTALAGDVALLDICRGLGAELQAAAAEGDRALFVGHANITGSLASNGQPAIGQELALDAAMLNAIGDVPQLLGHIHKPQFIHGAHYVGSVCRMDFGEVEEKRFAVVTYDDAHFPSVRFEPIPVAPMWHVEGTLTRDAWDWQVTAGPGGAPMDPPASWAGSEIRVRYRFAASERDVLPVGRVRDTFAGADRVDLEPVAVPDAQVRAPQVAAARTLIDKLTAWADLNGQALPAGVRDKLAQLEHADPAAICAAVSQLIAQAADVRQEGRAA